MPIHAPRTGTGRVYDIGAAREWRVFSRSVLDAFSMPCPQPGQSGPANDWEYLLQCADGAGASRGFRKDPHTVGPVLG
jgi:hypothetical protein